MHAHGPDEATGNERRLRLALVLVATYMVAEALGGWWTGSLALLADAGHMLSDVFALSLSLVAIRLARRPASPQQTYGHHRSEILAALANGLLLVAVSVAICVEAFERIGSPPDVRAGPMLAIACGGLVINLLGLWVLRRGRKGNLNVRGAWLHVLSDALGSAAAIAAGVAIWSLGWTWADPVASLAIGILVIRSAWLLLRETLSVLMEWAPPHVDVSEVERCVLSAPGVNAVHDLHVWSISSGRIALSGHVVVDKSADRDKILQDVSDRLHGRFGIAHSTVQIETEDFDEPGGVCFT
jgi:cobalt-zinc-cadmium efflux system protein